jgi:hypothetical protein
LTNSDTYKESFERNQNNTIKNTEFVSQVNRYMLSDMSNFDDTLFDEKFYEFPNCYLDDEASIGNNDIFALEGLEEFILHNEEPAPFDEMLNFSFDIYNQ